MRFSIEYSFCYWDDYNVSPIAIIHKLTATRIAKVNIGASSNLDQIAQGVRQAIFKHAVQAESGSDTDSSVVKLVAAQISDFGYDSSSQKYAMGFQPSSNLALRFYYPDKIRPCPLVQVSVVIRQAPSSYHSAEENRVIAALMGGTITNDNNDFTVVFDPDPYVAAAQPIDYIFFGLVLKMTPEIDDGTTPAVPNMLQYYYENFDTLVGYSELPKLTCDEYIYIHGSPQSSILNTDGSVSDLLAVVPVNRQYNQLPTIQGASAGESQQLIKVSLNGLRSMRLSLTDRTGNLIKFGGEYMMKLAIIFDID